jgi:hypothetical protein
MIVTRKVHVKLAAAFNNDEELCNMQAQACAEKP